MPRMNALELLFYDICQYNDKAQECKNNYKRLENFDSYLNDRFKQLTAKRIYTLKFPFNLVHKKMIVDDLNDPKEIEKFNRETREFNSLLDYTKKLETRLDTLQIEIGLIADALTFDDYLECCKDYPNMKNKEEYDNIQDKLKGFKEYLHNKVK